MEHWTRGGEGITNFDPSKRWLFEKAIAESGMEGLYVSDEGIKPGDGPSFCDRKRHRSLSPFWRVFEAIQKEAQR